MKILALELSTARGSIAWLDGEFEFVREWPNNRKNSAVFFENVELVRKKAGVPETIIVGLGPGSYAGTRIAISAGIGLQHSSNARLIGYPSICAAECHAHEYCMIGDARRNTFFFARVCAQELVEGPILLAEADLKSKLETLDVTMSVFSSESLPQFQRSVICYPSALVLARIAQESRHSFFSPPLEPMYLREPHITAPKARTWT
jgi:tRNA threonylcarbamoyl adenosine modification protein YeaZ